MKVLFYTATAFFIMLGGVFAFYALQGPETEGGAKIVLSIDPTEAPAEEQAAAGEEGERDLYAEVAEKLQKLEAKHDDAASGAETGQPSVLAADENDRLPNSDPVEPQAAEAGEPSSLPAGLDEPQTADNSGEAAPEEQDEIFGLPPGTALAGLDDDRPLFKNIEAEQERRGQRSQDSVAATTSEPGLRGTQLAPGSEQQLAAASPEPETLEATSGDTAEAPSEQIEPAADVPPAAGEPRAAAESPAENPPSESLSATALPIEEEEPGEPALREEATGGADEQKAKLDAILAALNEQEEAAPEPAQPEAASQPEPQAETAAIAPAPAPPPPLPAKRPNIRQAALDGWGTSRVNTQRPSGAKSARVAILLRGVGRDDRNSSDAVNKLPPAVSLAFMPFAGSAPQWARKATELGHEVIVQLPLEPSDYPVNNPGPETLLTSSAPDENTSRVSTILGRFEGYSGVTNFLGGRLLQSKPALKPILEDIKSRGLIYIGEGNNSHAVARDVASEIGLRYGGADLIIDAQPTAAAIQKALARLVEIARKDGSAIGMGYASRATIEQLEIWSQSLTAEGVTLVPVGALAQTPGAS